jgi:NIPSNAP
MFARSVRIVTLAPGFALALALGGVLTAAAPIAAQTPPAAGAPATTPAAPVAPSPSVAKDSRCFEMRTYYAAPGRSEALHKRFREHTVKLFTKHGMTNVGYWVPDDKPDVIVYILAYPTRAARDASWKAFGADPVWQAAKKASEDAAGGSLTTKVDSVFLQSTDYSPVK